MSRQSRGAARERIVAEELRAEGWIVKGTGDAHGAIDLIALKRGERPRVLQIKGNVAGGPFMNFRQPERSLIQQEALQADADAWLVYAPPDRKAPRWLHPGEWP